MNLTNSSLWELGYLQNFSGQEIGLEVMRIPSFFTPIFNKNIIKIRCTSSTALPTRSRLGYIDRCITLDSNEINIVDNYALYLRDSRIFKFDDFGAYSLRFKPDQDIKQLTVSIFQFMG